MTLRHDRGLAASPEASYKLKVGGVDTLLPLIAVLRGTACSRSLRNLVISILRMAGHVSIAAALRHTGRDPLRAFRLLTGRK